jgi:hypothetical protein
MYSYQLFDDVIDLIIQIYIQRLVVILSLSESTYIILVVNQLASNQSAFNRLTQGCIYS